MSSLAEHERFSELNKALSLDGWRVPSANRRRDSKKLFSTASSLYVTFPVT